MMWLFVSMTLLWKVGLTVTGSPSLIKLKQGREQSTRNIQTVNLKMGAIVEIIRTFVQTTNCDLPHNIRNRRSLLQQFGGRVHFCRMFSIGPPLIARRGTAPYISALLTQQCTAMVSLLHGNVSQGGFTFKAL